MIFGQKLAAQKKTLKPPTKQFYGKKTLKAVSTTQDGVPQRHKDAAMIKGKPLPSMPEGQRIRRRWGIPETFGILDETSQNIVKVAHRLDNMVKTGNYALVLCAYL